MSSKSKAKKRKRVGASSTKETAGATAAAGTGSLLFSPSYLLSQGAFPSLQTAVPASVSNSTSTSTANNRSSNSNSSSSSDRNNACDSGTGEESMTTACSSQQHPLEKPEGQKTTAPTPAARASATLNSVNTVPLPLMSYILLPTPTPSSSSTSRGQASGRHTSSNTSTSTSISDTPSIPAPVALVSCPQVCALYLSGACHVTLLQGQVLINGHKLSVGSRTEVLCPAWTPAQHVAITPTPAPVLSHSHSLATSSGGEKKKNKKGRLVSQSLQWLDLFTHKYKHMTKHKAALTEVQNITADPLFATSTDTCMLLLEAIDIDNSEDWMLKAEDFSKYKLSYNTHTTEAANRLHLSSLLLGDAAAMTQCCLEHCEFPPQWVEAVDKVCRDLKTCPRTVLCGAKGVGKSTCLRYTLNRLLSSKGSSKCVALLDCDLGQSECNMSGLISLHILSAPILCPSHLRLRTPELSFFIGDTTVKADPGLFEAALNQLYERYLVLRDLYTATGDVASLSSYLPPSSSSDTGASCLRGGGSNFVASGHGSAAGSSSSSSVSSRTGFSALDDSPFSKFSLPLVVNTDGWIKSMGLEVLTTIIATTQPSHVIHLCTDKNRDLSALYQLGALPFSHNSVSSSVENTTSHDSNDSSSGDSSQPTAKIFTVRPVRNTASKIAAVDLRNLRLVAYFLRDSALLRGLRYPPLAQSDAMKTAATSSRQVLIRNGSLVDSYGLLALALRESQHEQRLPFAHASLRMIGPVLAPRLVLAAMNLSLVGLTKGDERRGERALTRIRIPAYVVEQLRGPVARGDDRAADDQETDKGPPQSHQQTEVITFALDCGELSSTSTNTNTRSFLAPCEGVGIVSDVDLLQQCLHIITPTALVPSVPLSPSASQEEVNTWSSPEQAQHVLEESDDVNPYHFSTSGVGVVRGNLQIPTSLLYCISDSGLCSPYLSSESCGEGSGKATGARTNLKRRSQQH